MGVVDDQDTGPCARRWPIQRSKKSAKVVVARRRRRAGVVVKMIVTGPLPAGEDLIGGDAPACSRSASVQMAWLRQRPSRVQIAAPARSGKADDNHGPPPGHEHGFDLPADGNRGKRQENQQVLVADQKEDERKQQRESRRRVEKPLVQAARAARTRAR